MSRSAGRIGSVWDEFLRFAGVGVLGFGVDVGVLYAGLLVLGLGPYSARGVSFLMAASSTWLLNRHITFRAAPRTGMGRQWAKFVLVNGIGGCVNYAVYAAIIAAAPPLPLLPALATVAGSLSGLGFNFMASRAFVFQSQGVREAR